MNKKYGQGSIQGSANVYVYGKCTNIVDRMFDYRQF